jgi:hypothetical protein
MKILDFLRNRNLDIDPKIKTNKSKLKFGIFLKWNFDI